MVSSTYNWYCLSVYSNVSTQELSIDAMLTILEEHCKSHYISWNPVYIEEGGKRDETENVDPKFCFYVRTYSKAMGIKHIPKESKIWLHNKPKTPLPKIDDEFKLKIRQIILKRLTPDIIRADLSKLWEDEHWGDIFCALSNKDCMTTAIETIGELMPRLHSLDLSSNFITDLSAFEGIESHLPQLKTILLKGNQLENLESLKIFEKLPLVELELEGNPVCTDAYRLDVAKVLPNLKVVDGRPVQRKSIRRLLAASSTERMSRHNFNETSKDNMLKIERASSRSCSLPKTNAPISVNRESKANNFPQNDTKPCLNETSENVLTDEEHAAESIEGLVNYKENDGSTARSESSTSTNRKHSDTADTSHPSEVLPPVHKHEINVDPVESTKSPAKNIAEGIYSSDESLKSVENIFNNDHKESHTDIINILDTTTSIDSCSVPFSTEISDKLQNSNCSSNTKSVPATTVANGNKIDIDVAQPTKNPNEKRADNACPTFENSENLQSAKSNSDIPLRNDLDNALDMKIFSNTKTVPVPGIISVTKYCNESNVSKITKFSTDSEISPITQSCFANSSQKLVMANKNKIDTNIPQPTKTPDKIAKSSESLHRKEVVSKNHIPIPKESCIDMESALDTKIATSIDSCSTALSLDLQATKLSTNITISPIAKSCSVTENYPTELDKNHLDSLKSITLDPKLCCLCPENSTNSKPIPKTLSPSRDKSRTAVVSPTEKLSFQNQKNYEQRSPEDDDSMNNINTTLSGDAIITENSNGEIERDSLMAVKDILRDKNTDTVKQQSTQNTDSQRSAAYNDLQLFLNAYLDAFDNKQEQLRWFYHEKAMVVFFKNKNKDEFQEMGLDDALARFRELPQTAKHLLPSITVNLTMLEPDRICFTISGIQKTHGYRYFIRTFVMVPLSNVEADFRIWNEYIYTDDTTYSTKMALKGKMFMPITRFKLNIEIFLSIIEFRLTMFTEITNMKRDWCYKCLVNWNWNMDDALMIFIKMNQQKLIPDVAFMPTH